MVCISNLSTISSQLKASSYMQMDATGLEIAPVSDAFANKDFAFCD